MTLSFSAVSALSRVTLLAVPKCPDVNGEQGSRMMLVLQQCEFGMALLSAPCQGGVNSPFAISRAQLVCPNEPNSDSTHPNCKEDHFPFGLMQSKKQN